VSHALAHWRDRFPILSRGTYLASHSLGAVPDTAADALNEYFSLWATEGILAWDGPWWAAVGDFAAVVEGILGAAAGTVVPMQNVTRGLGAVASCLDYSGSRNQVLVTTAEFTTTYPFWRGQEELGAEVVVVEPDALIDAITERTLIVPTSHVFFRTGALQDLGAITAAAHRHGAYVLGDGYQAVGTVPLDVTALDIDFYVGGAHKWLCGGPGAGFLYVRSDHATTLRPRLTGWFGLKNPFAYEPGSGRPDPNEGVYRFLGGTPNVPALYAAREGLKIVSEIGVPAIRDVSKQLTGFIVEQADARGLTVATPRDPDARNGMICLDFPGSKEASEALVAAGITVDWRPDCGIRVSPHFYNTVEDLERFFSALDH